MASDYLLVLDGIQGETQASHHSKQIDIHSFSFGSSISNGGGTGKVIFSDLHYGTKAVETVDRVFAGYR